MTREEYDKLPSNGRETCPDCHLRYTTPYPNCGCPDNPHGYGTEHINLWHHNCDAARAVMGERK